MIMLRINFVMLQEAVIIISSKTVTKVVPSIITKKRKERERKRKRQSEEKRR